MLAVLAVVFALAAWTVRQEFQLQREQARQRVLSINELRATQVEAWLARQMTLAGFLSSSQGFSDQFRRWQDEGAAEAGELMLTRVVAFRRANESDTALIFDGEGRVLAREHDQASDGGEALRALVRAAAAGGAPMHSGLYRHEDAAIPIRLDVAVPLVQTGAPARGVIVLRLDARRSLYPMLSTWPGASASGETVLWRPDGDRVLALSELRHRPDSAVRYAEAAASSGLPLARLLRREVKPGEAMEARDYRGAPVIATLRPVQGTDWWLVSKIDLAEVDAPTLRYAGWTAAAVLLALLGAWQAARVARERRALAEARLAQQQQAERLQALGLLEAIAEGSSDAIFAKDMAGRFVFFNRAASEEVGRPREQVIGRTLAELFGPEVAERLGEQERPVFEGGGARSFEVRIPTVRGERTQLSAIGPLFDAQGRQIGLFGVSRDITEMRRAERSLLESEVHYRTVVSVLNEGIVVCDPQGRVLSCNPAGEHILGVRQADWAGGSPIAPGWTPVRPDGSEMALEDLPPGRVLAGGPAERGVLIAARQGKDAPLRWFEVSAVPVHSPDADGRLLAVVTSFSEVTERKRLDDELQRYREKLEERVAERTRALQASHALLEESARFNRTVTDNLPGRVAYWDAGLVCRFANRAYFEWFEKTPAEVLNRRVDEIFGEDYLRSVRPMLDATLAGQPQHFERETRRADGELFVHQVHYIPDQPEGQAVRGVYVMAFDISQLKRAESALKRVNAELERSRDQAEAANRAKSAFLANMSHEIRTPMNAIIGLTHLMARDTRDALQRERLQKVDGAAQHLLEVINAILDLSKIEAGKMVLEQLEFSLDSLLARAFEMVGERARAKGVELVLDTNHLPDRLRGDPTRLAQALINLLSNAVKFTQRGWVRLRCELLGEEGRRLHVRFEVQDTGEGIALDRQGGLFNAFEQADSSMTRRHGGTGLGLALTRGLAEMMGGQAGVVSAPGVGSQFWFTAWLDRPAEAGEAAAPIALRGLRALLVDDLPEALQALTDQLEVMGLQVDALDSGEAAIRRVEDEMAAGRAYDVLLVDWRMPAPDGFETLRRLRLLLGEGMPPALLISSQDSAAMWQQAREVHCAAVLVKPITSSALHDALVRVLRGSGAPMAVQAGGPGGAEARLRRAHAGQRVLLAEDNPINQEVAEELLRSAGLVAEIAGDGEAAVALALSRHYDLILMDLQMPVVDGLSAARRIREQAGRGTPIVAMTANAFGEDRLACLEAGMNDHVPKPVDPELLYATLLRWLPLREPAADTTAQDPPRAAPDERPLQERLAGIEGFEVARALRNVGGQAVTMERVLRSFVKRYREGDPLLAEGLREPQACRNACHSLRGACATIGAEPLHQRLRAFEQALHAPGADAQALAAEGRSIHQDLAALVARLAAELGG